MPRSRAVEDVRDKLRSLGDYDDDSDLYRDKFSSLLEDESNKYKQFVEFSKGKGDLQTWVEANRIIYGKPFRYDDASVKMMLGEKDKKLDRAPRPYLMQYINDQCPDKTTIKCRQSEFTEAEINENIYICASRPFTNARHIFPTQGMANKMGTEKVAPAMEKSPRIAEQIVRPFNITKKEFTNGSFYTLESSWTDYQGRGPSSDKITFDEYEQQNPQIEDIWSESTSHSEIGRRSRISTPLFPGSGIDEKFKKGCQYEWHVVCPKCKKDQILEFPDNLIGHFEINTREDMDTEEYMRRLNRTYIGCKFCGEYIDRTSDHYVKTSRWVAMKPHLVLERASYRVTYMMLPWKTGKEVEYKYHSFKYINQFWNEVMGYAYISPEARISRDIFEQCQDKAFVNQFNKIGQARNVSVGVDWGDESWVVVRANGFQPDTRKPKVIYMEKIDRESLLKGGYERTGIAQAKRVADIAIFFNARIIVNDANGIGSDRNAYLRKMFPTKAWGCFYDTDEQDKQRRKVMLIQPQWSENTGRVTVSRLNTLKLLIEEYTSKKVAIPRIDMVVEEFIKHHANLAIERYQDEKTEAIFEVIGHTGPDHLAHADNYAKIGFDKFVNTLQEGSSPGVISQEGYDDDVAKVLEENIHPLMKGKK